MTASVRYKLNELLRVEDVAEKLGISLKTVRSWIYLKKVPFTRIGRRVYFAVTAIEEILQRNAIQPHSQQ
jgi:excisionase family DNA binding protein